MAGQTVGADPDKLALAKAPRNLKACFVALGFALNVTFAVYLTLVHVFGDRFSRNVLAWQNVSVYAASSSVVLLQVFADEYFDRRFQSHRAFSARILAGCVVMTAACCLSPFCLQVELVYVIGAFIGVFEGSALTATQQLAASVSGEMTKYVNTGFTLAQALPILLSVSFNFKQCYARECHIATAVYVGVPAALIAGAAGGYCYLLHTGDLRQAFVSLDRRFVEEQGLLGGRRTPLCGGETAVAGTLQFLTQALSMALMPFVPFLGSLELAHDLILARFAGELVGRLLSHAQQSLDVPKQWVTALVAATVLARGGLLAALVAGAYGTSLDPMQACWLCGLFYALAGWGSSEVFANFVDSAPTEEAARARLMMLLGFAAQLAALAATVPVVVHLAGAHE